MTMVCDVVALSRYLDGELPPEQYRAVAEHVVACAPCRAELTALREINRLMVDWGSRNVPLPIDAANRTRAEIGRRARFPRLLALSRASSAAVGTAAAALLLMVTMNLAPLYQSISASPPPRVQTRTPELQQITERYQLKHNLESMLIHSPPPVWPVQRRHTSLPD
ncbi:MAG TPA: zf-HC2 domain-containing protein [Chloroflexota bacterium]|nr:zf-HC2 domain-containing protein [Chloroflexota bacterium]